MIFRIEEVEGTMHNIDQITWQLVSSYKIEKKLINQSDISIFVGFCHVRRILKITRQIIFFLNIVNLATFQNYEVPSYLGQSIENF